MKLSSGIVRRLDELGRIVIPIEMRSSLDISPRDPIEISMEGSTIILKKYENRCVFCGAIKPAIKFEGKLICNNCLQKINKQVAKEK